MKPEGKLQVNRPDPAAIRYLKKRRRRRVIFGVMSTLLVASVVAGHLPIAGHVGDDWGRFDHRSFIATAFDGDVMTLDGVGPVRPAGIVIPTGKQAGAIAATGWWSDQVRGKPIALLVVGPATRDPDGALRARPYVNGIDLEVVAVKAGMAYADRRGTDPFRPALTAAEAEARKHDRGLWAGLKFDQMPPWRQDWLKTVHKDRR